MQSLRLFPLGVNLIVLVKLKIKMRQILYYLLLISVFQKCRCNNFESTDARARQYVELTIYLNESYENKSISIEEKEGKLYTVKHLSEKPWKKTVRFAFEKLSEENENIDSLGKEKSEKFSFSDSEGQNYEAEIFYTTSFRLISPNRAGIIQYKINKIICGDRSIKYTTNDWLHSSYYESDATIYL